MLVLFTDTDCDVTPAIAKEYGYKLISMPYSVDGKTTYPYIDFDVFDAKAFYNVLRTGVLPNTSAVSRDVYISYFEPIFAAGSDILYVHFSRAMSASFEAMDQAVAMLKSKYPGREFYSVDTKGISAGSLYIVRFVGDLYKAGKSAPEIVQAAKDEVDHIGFYFFVDDLKFFMHSGRVSGLAGTMGTLLGIRPIIYVGDDGKMTSIGKEKGRTKAVARLMSYIEELGDDVKNHRVIIGHSDCLENAELVAEEIRNRFGRDIAIEFTVVNPTIGSHCGPNGVGIVFHAKHR
ncbi:MAG: DegV family protein [Clostridia bacterium]|nr:DegV family protein [Clostridia bacterium]